MSEEMSKDMFAMLWEKVSEQKKATVFEKINHMVNTNIANKTIIPNVKFNWIINLAFDKETPIEYMYIKGSVVILPVQDHSGKNAHAVMVTFEYIDISNNVDDFLDRQNSITKENSSIYVFDSTKTNTEQDVQPIKSNPPENIDNTILSTTDKLKKEMNDFVDSFRASEIGKNVSHNDIKDIFFLQKINELQSQINNLKSNIN